jgi:gliding motility-associated-like protein
MLATVSATDTVLLHENLSSNTFYSYFVRAFSQGNAKTSTSCIQSVRTYDSPVPEFMYIRYVTVEENDRVNLFFLTDTGAHVQYYRILRSEAPGGPFEEVGQVADQGLESIEFLDQSAEVNSRSYYYHVEVIDSCGVATVIANTSRTILLEVAALDNYQNVLTWNGYESWDGSVAGYRVYRRLNDSPTLDMVHEGEPGELTYTDDVSDLTGSAGRMSYLVEAYEGAGAAWDFRESSYSNEVIAEQESRIYVPNALLPKGLNNVLKPVSVFVGNPGYEFLVYNRWGQLLFETSDPDQGWDGTYNGNYVEAGVYVYLIRYRNTLDQPRYQKGNVAVIY